MLVVCKGYKTCVDRNSCIHSKPHEFTHNEYRYNSGEIVYDTNNCFHMKNDVNPKCHCDSKFLRGEKLEKLKNVSSL